MEFVVANAEGSLSKLSATHLKSQMFLFPPHKTGYYITKVFIVLNFIILFNLFIIEPKSVTL